VLNDSITADEGNQFEVVSKDTDRVERLMTWISLTAGSLSLAIMVFSHLVLTLSTA